MTLVSAFNSIASVIYREPIVEMLERHRAIARRLRALKRREGPSKRWRLALDGSVYRIPRRLMRQS